MLKPAGTQHLFPAVLNCSYDLCGRFGELGFTLFTSLAAGESSEEVEVAFSEGLLDLLEYSLGF